MKKPRKNNAQSVVEFIVIFVIVAVASVLLANRMPEIFNKYVNRSTKCITEDKCNPEDYAAAVKT
ncbi:MAG: hypothetical protein WC364_14535 [Eubacteriales bacterium]|jgi:hypothetical protein